MSDKPNNESRKLLEKLEFAIKEEASIQRETIEKQWRLPLEERIHKGKAISRLRFSGINEQNGNLIFICDENNSLFRIGDILFFHRNNPLFENCIECMLEYDDDHYIEVNVRFGDTNRFEKKPTDWIADEGYLDLTDLYLHALSDVADKDVGRNRILPLFLGRLKPCASIPLYLKSHKSSIEAGLDNSQAESAAQAAASDLAYLIQGPPGTGKTIVIAHIVRLLVSAGERVLITSFTHRAINNALNKIAEVNPTLPVCKIGEMARTDDLNVPNFESFSDSPFASTDQGYVIGATPFATRSSRLSGVDFETIIFDEASQITLPLALMGMLVGKRYIFVDDDKQLPPVVMSPRCEESLTGASIFGLLSGRGFESMLNVTYRMNQILTEWPSKTFYMGRLRPAPHVKDRKLDLPNLPMTWPGLLDPNYPAVFADLRHTNTTIRSYQEAKLVTELIVDLVLVGIDPSRIGVVTPYRRQGREIRKHLKRVWGNSSRHREIVIDTVERMQGQERDVILVSLATSNPSFAEQLAEFFFQPNRLNVTITRARTKLIVIGSSEVLKASPFDPKMKKRVDYLKDFLGYCQYYDVSKEMRWQESSRKKS